MFSSVLLHNLGRALDQLDQAQQLRGYGIRPTALPLDGLDKRSMAAAAATPAASFFPSLAGLDRAMGASNASHEAPEAQC